VDQNTELQAWLEAAGGDRIPVGENFVLGRSADCQVTINDTRVSRRHFMIHRQGAREFWLVDLGSANGTRLNGRRVSQPCRLCSQDRLEVADFHYVFCEANPATKVHHPSLLSTDATVQEIRNFKCWLLVADIVGSTQIQGRLHTEQAATLTGRWLARCKMIIDTYHGVVNKFLGDGFLAYWADKPNVAPEVAGALQAFQSLQAEANPAFRVVLHYGPAISGGAPSLGEESLAGKEVTFAFRMEDLASSLGMGLLISEPAAMKLQTLLEPSPAGLHEVNGYTGTYSFFTLS
jgi:class 3 adenylate cyclase